MKQGNAGAHHFLMLDGMRGLAAISVMLFHRQEWFGGKAFFGHAYLAVDFFFMLSGFVIAHAYGDRLGRTLSLSRFAMLRAVRLMPMIFAGVALGTICALGKAFVGAEALPAYLPLTIFASLLTLPAWWTDNPWPIDPPLWSIFFELVANAAFGFAALHLSRRNLLVACMICGLMLFGASIWYGSAGVGWDQKHFFWGFPRVGFSFFMGVLLYRVFQDGGLKWIRLGWLAPAILVATFLFPKRAPGTWLYDPLCILVLYPAIVLSAARTVPLLPKFASLSGRISYPLYVLHEPMLWAVSASLVLAGFQRGIPDPVEGLARMAVAMALSWIALRVYDEPVRVRLGRLVRKREHV